MKHYWILTPKGNHRSFRIMQCSTDGKLSQVKDERLTSINQLYKKNLIDAQVAEKQTRDVMAELRKLEKGEGEEKAYLESNLDIFQRYFEENYESREILPNSLKAAKASFYRALNILGSSDLTTVSEREVQKKIFALPHRKRQHVVLALKALFKYSNRPLKIQIGKKRTDVERVRHLSLSDFFLLLPHISNKLVQTMAATAFASGCRVGEIFEDVRIIGRI